MGKQSDPPPAPDYSGIASASAESARLSYELGKDQLAWAKQTYASDKQTTDKVVNAALETQEATNANAAKDRARYETTYQPLEDQFIQKQKDFADPTRIEQRAGAAASDVSQQFTQARTNATAQLESFGVDPTQTRAAALDLGTRTQEAAARAGAANNSRLQSEGQATAMLGSAIDIGRGYPGQVAQSYTTGLSGGNQAASTTLGQTASGASTMGTNMQYQGLGNAALGTWSNALSSGYNSQMQRYSAQQQQSSGLGGLLGLGLGMGAKALTGGLFEEGGAVPGPEGAQSHGVLPISRQPNEGAYVPHEASPSRGAVVDDIPAVTDSGDPAKINAGEFIIPRDAVEWLGQQHMEKMIAKARKDAAEAQSKPKMGALNIAA